MDRLQRRRLGWLLAAFLVLASAAGAPAQPAEKSSLPVVSYEQLGKLVRSLKGKVVVVYFWADL